MRGETVEQEIEDMNILSEASAPLRAMDLRRAEDLTCGDRNTTYGHPVENMANTANIFNTLTGHSLSASDAALFFVVAKMARLQVSPGHADSVVDAMAYLGIYHECTEAEK